MVIIHMSYSLNSLKGVYLGDSIGVVKGYTRSLDYLAELFRPVYDCFLNWT